MVKFGFDSEKQIGGERAISSLTEEHCVLRTIRSSLREYGNERFVCFIWFALRKILKKYCVFTSLRLFFGDGDVYIKPNAHEITLLHVSVHV